jgi:hypothetical protein
LHWQQRRHLKNRIMIFIALPLAGIDRTAPGAKPREIGNMDGSTFGRPRAG